MVQADDGQGGVGAFEVTVTVTDQNEGAGNSGYRHKYRHHGTGEPRSGTGDLHRHRPGGPHRRDHPLERHRTGRRRLHHHRGRGTHLQDQSGPRAACRLQPGTNEYEVTVRASDGQYYGTLEVTVTVEAVKRGARVSEAAAPIPSPTRRTVPRPSTPTAPTDPEGSDITWQLSGADGSAFEISGKGVLTFSDPPRLRRSFRLGPRQYLSGNSGSQGC